MTPVAVIVIVMSWRMTGAVWSLRAVVAGSRDGLSSSQRAIEIERMSPRAIQGRRCFNVFVRATMLPAAECWMRIGTKRKEEMFTFVPADTLY